MANTKVTQHVIADDAITTAKILESNVTAAKLFDIYITLEIEIFMKRNQGSICLCKVIY